MRLGLYTVLASLGAAAANARSSATYDVVVYGATPGGIMTALGAAGEGSPVLLVHPLAHVGGMVTGGLGETDHGNVDVIGGPALSFFESIGAKYGKGSQAVYAFEPHVAESVFTEILQAQPLITLVVNMTVVSVAKSGTTISSISVGSTSALERGEAPESAAVGATTFSGRLFVDASYEGDLLPLSGVSYAWGREGAEQYNESLAGRLIVPNGISGHEFKMPLNYTWPNGTVLPMIYTGDAGKPGDADGKVQAYNFRLCLTTNSSNSIPFTEPPGYEASYWELARRYYTAAGIKSFTATANTGALPNEKFDCNNNGPISSDFIGGSWGWPEGTPQQRAVIWDAHNTYTRSWLWFLTSDPGIPAELRADTKRYGLCADEFTDSQGWPAQLYVREGRRMASDYVFTQWDRQFNLNNKNDSVGLFSYNIDTHNAQRFIQGDFVRNEGDVEVLGSLGPGQMPYRLLTPRVSEATNLLVPVATSASHIGFGTIRLEPQWMILGTAAGVAAAQALKAGVPVQQVDVVQLQARLVQLGQKISWPLPAD